MFNDLSRTQIGLLFAFAGFTSFAFADICSKYLTDTYDLLVILFWNYVIASASLLIARSLIPQMRKGDGAISRKVAFIHGKRALVNFAIGFLVVYSFSKMPIATAYTFIFTMPLFAALLGRIFYGEAITWPRAVTIGIGFVGVVIAMQPGVGGFNILYLIPLFCSFLIALLFSISKSLEGQSIFSLGFWPLFAAVVCLAPYISFNIFNPGFSPAIEHLVFFVFLGSLNAAGLTLVSLGFRMAPAAAASPLLYTEMIWALIFGYLVFGDVPSFVMMVGTGLIIGSGVFLTVSEKWRADRKKRAKAA